MNKFKENLKIKEEKINGNNLPTMYKIYNKKGKYLGRINHSYEKIQNNWINGICIFLETENGKIVMQHRGNTSLNAKQDDFCSGHVDNDEVYMQAAYREAREELGLEEEKIKYLTKILEPLPLNFEGRKFFIQFFYAKTNSKDIVIDHKEVESYYEEEIELAFNKLREGKTKFPYKGNEEEFEKLIEEVKSIRKRCKSKEQKENNK